MTRLVIGCALLMLGLLLCATQGVEIVDAIRTRKNVSPAAIVAVAFVVVGCLLLPGVGWRLGILAVLVAGAAVLWGRRR